ncbi:AraC family transcriptional regulator [Chitinibacter sp. FCG-7]|uniref:AraC family transcriptional regulator n=1 Tax=Chitinibacter mangrovi TaxID=3153927 RepID=A0AAU7FB28_9NEIS
MPTIYYERFELDQQTKSDASRLVGAHVFHQASCPAMREYGLYMCGVGKPDGPCEIERIDPPFHVLLVLLGGTAEIFEDNQRWTIGAGEFAVLPARGRRGFRRIGDAAMPHVWFLLNDEPRWQHLHRAQCWLGQTSHGARLYDAVSLFQREAQLGNAGAHDTLVLQSLDIVSRQLERLLDLAQERPQQEQALVQLLDSIRRDPAGNWSVSTLCQHVGLGATQLHRLCQRRYGRAPAQLVFDIRMQLARDWLAQGQRVANVATALGYQEIASFSRRFSRHFGCPPSKMAKPGVAKLA